MSEQQDAQSVFVPAPTAFDRRRLAALCEERKKDYESLDIFAFQRDGFLAKKKPKKMSEVEFQRRLQAMQQRHGACSRTPNHYRRAASARAPIRVKPAGRISKSADARGDDLSRDSFASSKAQQHPDLFVIGSKTPKRRSKNFKHSTQLDTGSTEGSSSSSLKTIKSNRRSWLLKSPPGSQRISTSDKFDPNLLETTDDEEYIFHAPYQLDGTIVVNNMSFAEPRQPARDRHHQLSDPGRFSSRRRTVQSSCSAHRRTCSNRSVLRWVANKFCRSPTVKHQ